MNDLYALYELLLTAPESALGKRVFNAAYDNCTVRETAHIVSAEVPCDVEFRPELDPDARSYRVTSARLRDELGFVAKKTTRDAVCELAARLATPDLADAPDADRFYNLRIQKRYWADKGEVPRVA